MNISVGRSRRGYTFSGEFLASPRRGSPLPPSAPVDGARAVRERPALRPAPAGGSVPRRRRSQLMTVTRRKEGDMLLFLLPLRTSWEEECVRVVKKSHVTFAPSPLATTGPNL